MLMVEVHVVTRSWTFSLCIASWLLSLSACRIYTIKRQSLNVIMIREWRLFEGSIYLKPSFFLLYMVTEHLNFKKQKHVLFLVQKVIFYIVLNFKMCIFTLLQCIKWIKFIHTLTINSRAGFVHFWPKN